MMPIVGRLGPILKQKMPNPKAGTVSPNVGQVIRAIKGATRVEYRVDKNGIIHSPVGKANFTDDQLRENIAILVDALLKAKPAAAKGKYLQKVALSASMGPSVSVDVADLQKVTDRR
jgi:large subunit ribosomal protein L1